MKLTLANIKELKRKSDSPLTKRVCNYVIDRWGDYDDKKHIFTDVLHYGCQSGVVGELIYYIVCPIEKFTEYLFVENKSGGKKHLFESWGYRIIDSETLASEFRKQANLAYLQGDYVLGNLDQYGERIGITITIPRKNGAGNVSFLSGWMVYPDGQLFLITPYGGK